MTPPVRFDDLRAGRAFTCPAPEAVLTAATAGEVLPVLEEVERATAAGRWAYGYLAYEAAPGLDADLVAHDPRPGDPPLGLVRGRRAAGRRRAGARPARRLRAPWRPDWTDAEHAPAPSRPSAPCIAAGDTYQCNLTDRLRTTLTASPEQLYAALAGRQARRLPRLARPRRARGGQREPRAVRRLVGRRPGDPADEGHGGARRAPRRTTPRPASGCGRAPRTAPRT